MTGKVQPDSLGLCGTCTESFIREDRDGVKIECSYFGPPTPVAKPIYRCSGHRNNSQPSKFELEKIAWVLDVNKSGKVIGFSKPKVDQEPQVLP